MNDILLNLGWLYKGRCGHCAGSPHKWTKRDYVIKISGNIWRLYHKGKRTNAGKASQLEEVIKDV